MCEPFFPAKYDAGYHIAENSWTVGYRSIAVVGYAPPGQLRPLTSVAIGTRLNDIRAAFQQASARPAALLQDLLGCDDAPSPVLAAAVLTYPPIAAVLTAMLLVRTNAESSPGSLTSHGVVAPTR